MGTDVLSPVPLHALLWAKFHILSQCINSLFPRMMIVLSCLTQDTLNFHYWVSFSKLLLATVFSLGDGTVPVKSAVPERSNGVANFQEHF